MNRPEPIIFGAGRRNGRNVNRKFNHGMDDVLGVIRGGYTPRQPQLPAPPKPAKLDAFGQVWGKDGRPYRICPLCHMWDRNVSYHASGCMYTSMAHHGD